VIHHHFLKGSDTVYESQQQSMARAPASNFAESSFIAGVLNAMDGNLARLHEILVRTVNFNDRMGGPKPSDSGKADGPRSSVCAMQEVSLRITTLADLVSALESEASRL
jgi:hypothetical protein